MASIAKAGAREKLAVDHDAIHWTKIRTGQAIGFRKTSAEYGTWWARAYDADARRYRFECLGDFGDRPHGERYDQAVKAALAWFATLESGVVAGRFTVRFACEEHIAAIRADEGDRKADNEEARFKRYVYDDPIARIELAKLRPEQIAAWKRRLQAAPAKGAGGHTRKRSPADVNRNMVPLRAALNRALDRRMVASDLAWRVELKPLANADRRRDVYLDRADRKKLLKVAGGEIGPFLRALALLPLRPGALAALTVADFDPRRGTLRIGHDKTGHERRIAIPESTSAFLRECAKGKLPAAPLVGRSDGRHWDKDAWKWPIKDAVLAADLPGAVTAYALRHSVITDLVTGGLDLLTVAQISGTSVAMIERFYGHLQTEHAAKALASLAL